MGDSTSEERNKPVTLEDMEELAKNVLPSDAYDYFRSGSDREFTLSENIDAFRRYRLRQRVLVDVSAIDLKCSVLGGKVKSALPIGISATSGQTLAHKDGDLASVRAAEELGIVHLLSTATPTTIEQAAPHAPSSLRWFQLFVYKDREFTRQMVRRAEASGYAAIVVCVDSAVIGRRVVDIKNNFSYIGPRRPSENTTEGYADTSVTVMYDTALTWNDISWIQGITSLPVILKGIMTGEDAAKAVELGVAGITVSNHGGRQLDGTLASIDALPDVMSAVAGRCDVYLDGGIRHGTDVLKALALGAKMVFIGRPVMWGLAYGGKNGVKKVVQILKEELVIAMALTGCASLNNVSPLLVVHQSAYPKL